MLLPSLRANWLQSPDTEGSHMARMLGIVLPYNPLLLAWFPCCMYSTTLQSSSLRLGNLKGKPKIWFAFVENMFFFVKDCDVVSP